jgi:hypothetical protein
MERDKSCRGLSSKSSTCGGVGSDICSDSGVWKESSSVHLLLLDTLLARSSSLSKGLGRFRDIGDMGAMVGEAEDVLLLTAAVGVDRATLLAAIAATHSVHAVRKGAGHVRVSLISVPRTSRTRPLPRESFGCFRLTSGALPAF